MDYFDSKYQQERSLTVYECPLCRIKMDLDCDYQLKYFWCDDCRARILRYWKPLNL